MPGSPFPLMTLGITTLCTLFIAGHRTSSGPTGSVYFRKRIRTQGLIVTTAFFNMANRIEPLYKIRVVNRLNKQCAESKEGLILRQPQANHGDCLRLPFKWTDEDARQYLANGTLPCDLTNIDPTGTRLKIWIFEAGSRIESNRDDSTSMIIEADPQPDLKAGPGLCVFSMSQGGTGHLAMIPTEAVEVAPMGGKLVKLVVKGNTRQLLKPR